MSKSSSSKVYFVLYLAVILELLIIIVERDEAEELFFKRQKELEEQVATLLVFMNPSAVSEPINVSQRGLIVFDEEQPDPQGCKRTYTVNVAVNNPATSSTLVEKIQRGNVRDMQYYLLTYRAHGESDETVDAEWNRIGTQRALAQINAISPHGKSDIALRDSLGNPTRWLLKSHRRLVLDEAAMLARNDWQNPLYTLSVPVGESQTYSPRHATEKRFFYSVAESDTREFRRRAFGVEFVPERADVPLDQGNGTNALHCKLLFASLSDNVVGVSTKADDNSQVEDARKVNVGGMPIRLGLLRTMQASSYEEAKRYGVPTMEQAVTMTSEQFERAIQIARQNAEADRNNNAQVVQAGFKTQGDEPKHIRAVKLYGYITKLLTPQFARNFQQNQGVTAIDVKVIRKHSAQSTLEIYANSVAGFAGNGVNAVVEGVSSTDIGKLRATVRSEQGNVISSAQVKLFPMQVMLASAENTGSGIKQKGIAWYATLSGLQAGTYSVEITDGTNTDKAQVNLYEPQAEAQRPIANWMVGGKVMSVRLNTPDGTAIPENQFFTIVELTGQATQTVNGKTVNVRCIPAKALGEAKVKLKWIEPHTKHEVLLKEWKTEVKMDEPYIAPQNMTITNVSMSGTQPEHRYMVELKLLVADIRADADCTNGIPIYTPVNARMQSAQAGTVKGRIISFTKQASNGGVSTYIAKVEFSNGEAFDNRDKSKGLTVNLLTSTGNSAITSHTLNVALR